MIEPNLLLFTFVFLYVAQSAFNIAVERINLNYSKRNSGKVPAGFEEFIDQSKLATTMEYTRAKTQTGIAEEILSDVVLLAILLTGFLPLLVGWSDRMGLPTIPAGLFFFLAPGLIGSLVDIPFSYYNTFVIEQKFGFNRSTLKLWIKDHLKSTLIGSLLFAFVFSILLLFIAWSPEFWWLWGFLLLSSVQLITAVLYPVVLAPLFNKFEPVKDEELADKIRDLMEKNGIRVKKILQMDAGMRSRHTNAYFTGIGKTKQIVLYDTLLESHTHDEILAVLAHEAGHFRKKHVQKQLLIFSFIALAGFYATWLFIKWPLLFSTFGFSRPLPYVGLFLAGIFWARAGFFLQPLYLALSRRFEREADMFAVRMIGDGAAMAAAMKRLASDNLSNLNPHPLYVWFHYSHPPVVERVEALTSN